MFFFICFLIISIIGFVFGIRALLLPDSWPFNLNKRELSQAEITSIRFRGIFILAFSIIIAIASLRQFFV
ncbi:hypothetical protein DN757_05680 [Paenibacillus silvae]|uniref:Uncharacterized protein n=1 Tax=Paenibacillus silvae TaxID=1325358 RepID=A0A2W6PAS4_9BACL|nr:hypothetical protein DN757_05680 [Paenibacillus silvae]